MNELEVLNEDIEKLKSDINMLRQRLDRLYKRKTSLERGYRYKNGSRDLFAVAAVDLVPYIDAFGNDSALAELVGCDSKRFRDIRGQHFVTLNTADSILNALDKSHLLGEEIKIVPNPLAAGYKDREGSGT